ncbi:hypothetical protein ABZ351_16800 [Streptomyces microflavus]|uniref:hypothetical protein n=1 Tax=Streptomyces microflavus TaxID=1919 RepID=UPI0033D02496
MDLPRITAQRVHKGWALHMHGLETLIVSGLGGAAERAREFMEAAGMSDAERGVQFSVDLGAELNADVKKAIQATVDAQKAQMAAAAQLRRTAEKLRREGLSGRDISHVLGVSPQRVSQLLQAAK